MARRWWRKRALRIYHPHTSVHEMVVLDVPAFVADCVGTNAEAIVVNAAGLYAYYPTKVSCHHVPNGLGDRDLLGEIVDAAKAQGLRVIARVDFSRLRQEDADLHPEWLADQGHGIEYLRTCPASAYQGEAFAIPVVEELIGNYLLDGLFVDGIGYPHEFGCAACDSLYGRSFRDIPEEAVEQKMDWYSWRKETLAAQQRALYDAAKTLRPELLCFGRQPGLLARASDPKPEHDLVSQGHALGQLGLGAELGIGHSGHVHAVGISAELARGARRKRRPMMIVSPIENSLFDPSQTPSGSEVARVAYQATAHGAGVMLESLGAPDAQTDPRLMPAIASVFGFMRGQALVLDGHKAIQEVGLLWPNALFSQARASGAAPLLYSTWVAATGLLSALLAEHVLTGIVHDRRMTPKALRRYGAVVVPALAMLSVAGLSLLLEYAREGGRVVICDTALAQADDGLQAVLSNLSEAMGCAITPDVARLDCAVAVESGSGAMSGVAMPLMFSKTEHRVIQDPGDAFVWLSEASVNPSGTDAEDLVPLARGEHVLMLSQVLGDGVVTYCSWSLGKGYQEHRCRDHASLVAQAARFGAAFQPRLSVDAPACIEVTMAHWLDGIVIHLVNHAGALMGDVTPIGPIELDLAWDGPASVVLAAPGQPDQALPSQEQWNRVTITVPRVDVYAQVVVRTG